MYKTIDLQAFKAIASNILFDFDSICRRHDIKYSITYGTLLGAVRHKGYIPWDDDIDVMMTRENYERFLSCGVAELERNHELVSLETNPDYASPLPKIINKKTILHQLGHIPETVDLGVYIDIFLLDPIPTSEKNTKLLYKICDFSQRLWVFSECEPHVDGAPFLNAIRRPLNKLRVNKIIAHRMLRRAKKKRNSNGYYSNLMFCAYARTKNEIDEKRLMDMVDYEFEGHKVMGIRDCDWYLEKLYGNYMRLPPVDKRVQSHEYTAFYL